MPKSLAPERGLLQVCRRAARTRRARAFGWGLVVLVAAALAFVSATAGRPPAADLAQHAVLLQHWMNHAASGQYRIYATSPYALYFGIARIFAAFLSPSRAVWLEFALILGVVPISAAALAAALGRNPAVGLFSLLGLFGMYTAWGFGALLLGGALMAFAMAAAFAYGRRPRAALGAALLVLLCLTYWAHIVPFAIAMTSAVAVVALRRGAAVLRPSVGWPLYGAAVASAAAFAVWMSDFTVNDSMRREFGYHFPGPSAWTRLIDLPIVLSSFGRVGAMAAPWWLLAAILLVGSALALARASRVARRLMGMGLRRTIRAWMLRLVLPSIAAACLVAYFTTPLMASGTFFVYPRFVFFVALLSPAFVPRGAATALLGFAAFVPAVWMTVLARREIALFAQATSCNDEISRRARPNEAMVHLNCAPHPRGYAVPVRVYTAAEIIADRGGYVSFDFADYGVCITYGQDWDREYVPSKDRMPWLYRHDVHGVEYTSWLLQGCPNQVLQTFDDPRYSISTCGDLTLVTDMSVEPGSRPATKYLPHRR